MARIAAYANGWLAAHPHFALAAAPFELLYGPLFYLYVCLQTGHRLTARDLRHAIPAVVLLVALVPFYLLPAEEKRRLIVTPTAGERRALLALWALNWTLLSAYLGAALVALRRHGERLRRNLSSVGHAGLAWLRLMAWLLVVMQFADAGSALTTWDGSEVTPAWEASAFVLAVLLYVFSFQALRQPELRYERPAPVRLDAATGEWARPAAEEVAVTAAVEPVPLDVQAEEEAERAGKYERSGLTAAEAEAIAARIGDLLDRQRLFVRSDLSLSDLAELVGAPTHHVSQALNERLGGSFFDVVNRRRVAEVQRLLADPRRAHLTVLALAYEAGFNSKTAFNAAFKQVTGTTPSAWRTRHLRAA